MLNQVPQQPLTNQAAGKFLESETVYKGGEKNGESNLFLTGHNLPCNQVSPLAPFRESKSYKETMLSLTSNNLSLQGHIVEFSEEQVVIPLGTPLDYPTLMLTVQTGFPSLILLRHHLSLMRHGV